MFSPPSLFKFFCASTLLLSATQLQAKDQKVQNSKEEADLLADNQQLADVMSGRKNNNGMQKSTYGKSTNEKCPPCSTSMYNGVRPDIQPYQINIKHKEAKGIGYKEGYTTLETFFSGLCHHLIPFLDLRGHVFNNGKLAANAGIGLRYMIDPAKYMVGINTYYDYRNGKHGHYNQWSAGLEGYVDQFEIRANGYLPVGKKTHAYHKSLTSISFKGFSGNNLLINENYSEKKEFAMKGFDAEVGYHLIKPQRDYDLYIGAGPYYYHEGDGRHAWGGKARVTAEVYKYLFFEVSDSWDHIFHNRFQGTVTLSIPFGGRKCRPPMMHNNHNGTSTSKNAPVDCFADNIMGWRGAQPPVKQEIVVVNKRTHNFTIDPVAYNAATGQPFFFVFVNNTNPDLGNGTYENPFQNLGTLDNATNAQTGSAAGNVVYVFEGDGTGKHMTNFVLQDSQRLLGSGDAHLFNTTLGSLTVPALSSGKPLITPVSAGLSLPAGLTNMEVSGFNIIAPRFAIGVGVGVTNYAITNNVISATLGGIFDNNGMGTITIDRNIITSPGTSINMAAANATVFITNNSCNGLGTAGSIGINATNSIVLGNVTGFITNNQCTNNAIGIQVNPGGNVNEFFVRNNIASFNNAASGVGIAALLLGSGNTGSVVIENNIATNNAAFNIHGFTTAATSGALCLRVNNNIADPLTTGGTADISFNQSGTTTLLLEPPVNNFGTIVTSGTINFVQPCACTNNSCSP